MAIGVVGFAFVAIFALLPAGLGIFRQAMDTSIGAQISQRVVGEAEQTDFDSLVPGTDSSATIAGVTKDGSGAFYALPLRYFDDQGTEILGTSAADLAKALYTVRVRGSMPGTDTSPASTFTSLPSTEGTRYNPRSVTFLTIQVVKNPGRKDISALALNAPDFLLDAADAKSNHLTVQTYSAVVARNGFRKTTP